MKTQHCGNMANHPPHEHKAHERRVVVRCVCSQHHFCICPASEPEGRARLQVFECTGFPPVREGAPAHLPVKVGV